MGAEARGPTPFLVPGVETVAPKEEVTAALAGRSSVELKSRNPCPIFYVKSQPQHHETDLKNFMQWTKFLPINVIHRDP